MNNLDLGKEKITKLLITFSIPCVISMLINSIYNIIDQIFIGKGVGTLGNGATNVIFPLIIIFNAVSSLIGNGAAANLSLKLGEGKKKEASKSVGQAIILIIIAAFTLSIAAFIALPKLVYLFGCTENVYNYAIEYGRIIIIGAPFMIMYTAFSNIIRADGSPKYSMIMLIVGAIINIILDPIFIFLLDMGVKGGALATIIGQIVTFLIAFLYIKKIKSVKIEKDSFILDNNVLKILGLGISSFITQITVLVLFVYMNNMMTKYGALSKFGADIPLSVYGVMSKINSLFISTVLGISIGAQPIAGFNYGAGNKLRVKEIFKKAIIINVIIGFCFNLIFAIFPRELAGLFITSEDESYLLFLEFSEVMCRSFLLLITLNAFEMTGSILIQSLGKVKKATALSFIRQIILFIPISFIMSSVLNKGIYGILYAGCISDIICFIIAIFIIGSEYLKLSKDEKKRIIADDENNKNISYEGKHIVITISREYGSGGRFVGKTLAKMLGVEFYDKSLISLTAKNSGLSEEYVEQIDEKITNISYESNNDDRVFIAESKVIEELYNNKSCVIVGRCADYILKDKEDVIKIFLYSDEKNKINRAIKYYNLNSKAALNKVNKINKERAKHYEYYTSRNWYDIKNYDLILNVDKYGVEKTAKYIYDIVCSQNDKN